MFFLSTVVEGKKEAAPILIGLESLDSPELDEEKATPATTEGEVRPSTAEE